jgi:hypothetical protein
MQSTLFSAATFALSLLNPSLSLSVPFYEVINTLVLDILHHDGMMALNQSG